MTTDEPVGFDVEDTSAGRSASAETGAPSEAAVRIGSDVPSAGNPPSSGSAVRMILRSPLLRGATIAMFLSGLGMSAAAPMIAMFLVRELGASLTTAGLFYLTNLTAPIVGFWIGSRSDRTGHRLGLFRLCAVAGFCSWAGIAVSTQIWMPFVIAAVVGGFTGAAGSQLFAAVHDELATDPHPSDEGVVAIVRMALTAGWVVGPVCGAWLAAATSLRVMLVVVAVCTLAQIVPLGWLRTTRPGRVVRASALDRPGPVPTAVRPSLETIAPLLAFTGLYVLVYAGESVKYGYLPIYLDGTLRVAPAISGAVIGIQPLVELALMPLSVVVGRRIGLMRLMALGAGFGVGANLCFAFTAHVVGMFAGQILMGGVWGVFAALGIIAAQRLLPTAVATASAIFMSSTSISSALGGVSGGLGVAVLGLPHVFLIPAACAALAVVGLLVMDRRVHVDR